MSADQSDWAVDLANILANDVYYPRMADFVTKAITHCEGALVPLSKEQAEQLYRAAFEAGDGVCMDIAHAIDQDSARRLVQTIDFPPEDGAA